MKPPEIGRRGPAGRRRTDAARRVNAAAAGKFPAASAGALRRPAGVGVGKEMPMNDRTTRRAEAPGSGSPGSGFPEADPFAGHQAQQDLAKRGARPRADPRRNTGDLPDPATTEKEAPPASGGAQRRSRVEG
jgi:hypothetical protein